MYGAIKVKQRNSVVQVGKCPQIEGCLLAVTLLCLWNCLSIRKWTSFFTQVD